MEPEPVLASGIEPEPVGSEPNLTCLHPYRGVVTKFVVGKNPSMSCSFDMDRSPNMSRVGFLGILHRKHIKFFYRYDLIRFGSLENSSLSLYIDLDLDLKEV